MLEVTRLEGHLVLVKVVSPVTLDEIAQADQRMRDLAREAGGKVLIAADYRQTKLLNQTEADALLAMFRRHNEGIEPSAVLVSSESAMAVLQMSRVIKQANLPTRRAFKVAAELVEWLGDAASGSEKQALARAFAG
ncbi:MAG: hypothetical protein ACOX6T_01585 [Myxococcales bacterium]